MDAGGLALTLFLVIAGLFMYVLFRWGVNEYNSPTPNKFMGMLPSYWVYLISAVLISLGALWLYSKIMQRGHTASYLITMYYIAIVVGVVIVSWLLFSHNPTKWQWVGIALVVIGLILYGVFEAEYIESVEEEDAFPLEGII